MSAPAIRVLELRSVRGTGGGPEKTILLGAARADRQRYAVSVCYLRDARDHSFEIDKRARALGLDYVEIRERHSLDPRLFPALRQVIQQRGIDIVHAHDYKTDLLALLLARFEDVIPLATSHGWSGVSVREQLYYFADRRILRRFPVVIAVSQRIRRTVVRHGARPEEVRHIPNGVDPSIFKRDDARAAQIRAVLSISPDAFVIGAIGRLEQIKRFDVLLEGVARSRLPEPSVIVLAGDGSLRHALIQRARALGVENRLRLLGHRDDILQVHHVLDLYVQSSDSEGIPNAVLEAMAVETPVIATDVGGTRELIDHNVHGLLVPRRDPAALAVAIKRTLGDPAATRQRVVSARARVERELSFEARMRAVETVYDELLTRFPRAGGRARKSTCA